MDHPSGPGDPGALALARSRDLAEQGDLRGAVDVLAEAVAAGAGPTVAQALTARRHELFLAREAPPAPATWPPPLDDPFPEVAGRPPEVVPSALSATVVGGAIQHHGCLLVRGLADAGWAAGLAEGIDRAFGAQERVLDGRGLPDDDRWYHRFPVDPGNRLAMRRRWVRDGGAVWAAESPVLMAQVVERFVASGLVGAIAGYLGEQPALSVNKFTLRRVAPDAWPSWHQDGAFMGGRIRTVNCWVALSDCGEGTDAPGLAVLPRRVGELAEVGTEGAMLANAVGQGVIDRLAVDAPVLHPRFHAGDVLLFDELFLHATGTLPGLQRDRYAIEAWFFAPGDVPEDYVGLAV